MTAQDGQHSGGVAKQGDRRRFPFGSEPQGRRQTAKSAPLANSAPVACKEVSIARWLAFYLACLVALAVPLAVLASHHRGELSGVWAATAGAFKAGTAGGATGLIAKIKAAGDALLDSLGHVPPSILLLSLATYMSVSTTFLPLPTGPVLAAMAMRGVVSDSFVVVLLLVPIIAALGSTLANLNDYHLFLLMLRNRHVAKVRHTKTYQVAARWFSRSPFLVIVIFNILPLPVDVVRMVSAIYGYGRKAFAASNFIGRLIRYMICAGVTFMLGKNGRIVVLAMLAIAVAMGLCKLAPMIARRIVAKSQ